MIIRHPISFSVEHLEEKMTAHLGHAVRYVMTSDLEVDDVPMDIFYLLEKPEDEKSRYIATPTLNSLIYTVSADIIESYDIGMIQDKDESWFYASSLSDCVMIDGNIVKGGRKELDGRGFEKFVVKDGYIVENILTEYKDYYWPNVAP